MTVIHPQNCKFSDFQSHFSTWQIIQIFLFFFILGHRLTYNKHKLVARQFKAIDQSRPAETVPIELATYLQVILYNYSAGKHFYVPENDIWVGFGAKKN